MNDNSAALGLNDLWSYVKENWQSASAHDAFVQACEAQDHLALAASRYRETLDSKDRDAAELAELQLKKITALAYARIDLAQSKPQSSKRKLTFLALLVCLLLMAACIFLMSR